MRNNHSGTGLAVVMMLGLLLVIGWIGNIMEPKCIKSDCDNSRADGSSYCSDADYASGVDDAMEDTWEEYGEDW